MEDTLSTDSVDNNPSHEVKESLKEECDMSNSPDEYKKLGVAGGDPIFHPSDLSKVPGGIIEKKPIQVFSLRICLVEERYELVHYAVPGEKSEWGYFPSEDHPEVVTRFEWMSPHSFVGAAAERTGGGFHEKMDILALPTYMV